MCEDNSDSAACRPLSMPEGRTRSDTIRDFFVSGFGLNSKAHDLVSQTQRREPPPDDVWGADPERRELAQALGQIIREEIGWPNAHFFPQDPMRLVLHRLDTDGLFWDHMEIESVFRRIEERFMVEISQSDVNRVLKGAYGEAIALLMNKRGS